MDRYCVNATDMEFHDTFLSQFDYRDCWFSLLWFSMFWYPMLSWSKITRFTVPPSYEFPVFYQAPFSRVSIFGRLRKLWVVEVRGILKSRSVVFNLCP
jgi:hypothetical protein